MLITKPGRLSEHLDLLGDAATPFYLVRGEEKWALVDAAVAPMVPELRQQLRAYPEVRAKLKYFLITHSHFDHVGGLSALRRLFPEAEVIASAGTKEVFSKPGPMNYIRTMNDVLVKLSGVQSAEVDLRVEESIPVTRVVQEGDRLELGGGVRIEVYDAPGHSRCNLAYFLVPDQAVFSGEAMGYYNGAGQVLSEGLSEFQAYLDSIAKMGKLAAKIICLPHNGVLTGDEAQGYFQLAHEAGAGFREEVREFFRQSKTDEDIIQFYLHRDYRGLIRLQPEQVFRQNLTAMLKAIRKEG